MEIQGFIFLPGDIPRKGDKIKSELLIILTCALLLKEWTCGENSRKNSESPKRLKWRCDGGGGGLRRHVVTLGTRLVVSLDKKLCVT